MEPMIREGLTRRSRLNSLRTAHTGANYEAGGARGWGFRLSPTPLVVVVVGRRGGAGGGGGAGVTLYMA